jgi:hypothetical protein
MAPLIHHNPQPAVRTTNPAQSLQFGSIFNKLHNIHCQEGNLEALALLPCLDRFQLLWSLSVILSSFRLPWPSISTGTLKDADLTDIDSAIVSD